MTILMMLMFVTCCLLAWWMWKRSRVASESEPPMLQGALPIIGHGHKIVGDSKHLWETLKSISYESLRSGSPITIFLGNRRLYVITDPDDSLTVANACLQKDFMYDFGKPWLGQGLVTGTLSTWKVHRKMLNPAFSQHVLDGFLGVFNSQSRRLVKELAVEVGKSPFDPWRYLGHNSLETICLTAMGVAVGEDSILNSEYVAAMESILNILISRFQRFWLYSDFIYNRTSHKRKFDKVVKVLHRMSNSVLQKRKDELNGNISTEENRYKADGGKFKAFLDLLLELAAEKNAFTDVEIREEVDTIIAAGHDTSATALMYTLILLGSHPHVQDCIYKELQEIFDNDDRDIEKQDLSRMVYLEAVLKESLRMYPIAPTVGRKIDKYVKLKNNYTLLPGSSCLIFLYTMHRHKIWGEDAELFKPERWLDPSTLPDNPNAFGGFSLGRRMCIGKTYAMMSMKVTLAHMLRHYRITADHSQLKFKLDTLLKPVVGHHISLEKRE